MSAALRVGIVGTGEMGRPLVNRLLAAGHQVAAYARRTEVRDELAAAGVEVVDDLLALAPGRDVLLVYVYRDDQVREVLLDAGLAEAMSPGSTIVVHTTSNPRTMDAIAERLTGRGVGVVDAPGSGGPNKVAAGTLTLFAGGAPDDVERCRPLFAAYAEQVVGAGGLGAGQRMKLLNNLLFGAHVELAVEAARLASELGLDPAAMAQALHTCSGASYGLDLLGLMGSGEVLVQAAGRFVHKDVLVARAVADDLGADLGTFTPVTDAVLNRTATA